MIYGVGIDYVAAVMLPYLLGSFARNFGNCGHAQLSAAEIQTNAPFIPEHRQNVLKAEPHGPDRRKIDEDIQIVIIADVKLRQNFGVKCAHIDPHSRNITHIKTYGFYLFPGQKLQLAAWKPLLQCNAPLGQNNFCIETLYWSCHILSLMNSIYQQNNYNIIILTIQ